MPLIAGSDLGTLVTNLRHRKALLWHACQLRDFISYVAIGGVPSRAHLTASGQPFTAFDTDAQDQQNAVWDKAFFNFSDFGNCFGAGYNCVPNCYGPIIMAFRPNVIASATNVSVTLRSAGAVGFDRVEEGLNVDDTERIFKATTRYVRYAEELEEEFGRKAHNPEMNCHMPDGYAPFEHLAYIVVDPYAFGAETLPAVMQRVLAHLVPRPRVFGRDCRNNRTARDYVDLWNAVAAGARVVEAVPPLLPADSGLLNWIETAGECESVVFQFPRYANYLANGTISMVGQI